MTYHVDGGPEKTFWRFDGLPGGSSIEAHVKEFYVQPLTCGNYQCRQLTLNLGFGQEAFPTTSGDHVLSITAKDDAGNATSKSYVYTVRANR